MLDDSRPVISALPPRPATRSPAGAGLWQRGARPSGSFAGKVVIITGSESGIGRETARAFARQGACVVLNGLNPDRLEKTRGELLAEEYNVVACVADVTDYADCERLIATAIDAFGHIDVLITNASISMRAYFADMQPEVFKRVLDSNVYGTVFPVKAALPWLSQSRGVVTFISSISALNGMPSGSAYCAGKAAMSNLANTLRLELHDAGIQFGVVHIGFTQNDPDKRVLDAEGQPVPIAHRPAHLQKTQTEVASLILRHVRQRRRRTIISALGRFMAVVHACLPRFGDWLVLTTIRRIRNAYE
jgi:NAD(P)-dependent dehydrogenase (short-subunit alcohol dehydrogenase family)